MNRIRAVIVALVAFATITTSCTPHDLAEWQQVTGIDLSPEHEQQILDCSTAKAEADALAPEHDYLDLDTIRAAVPSDWVIETVDRRDRHVTGGTGAGHHTVLVLRVRRP